MAHYKNVIKNTAILLLKIGVVAGLMGWMISADKLDLSALLIVIQKPLVLVGALAVWILGPVVMQAARWRFLLQGLGVTAEWGRSVQLQMIGLFFNTAMPGAVGGDVIKAIYVVRDQQSGGRTAAAMSVLVDRVVGLFGMFSMGAVAVTLDFDHFWNNPVLRSMMLFNYACVAGMAVFVGLVLIPYGGRRDLIRDILSWRIPGFPAVLKIYTSLRNYRHHPRSIIYAWVLSIGVQLLMFGLFALLTHLVTGQDAPLAVLVTIYSLGALTTALPIAPGGLGVGHVAFDRLFHVCGLTGGANVFNVFCLLFLALNMLGAIPYLLTKGQMLVNGSATQAATAQPKPLPQDHT